jgi:cupin 2 domain-containing protein
MTHAAPPPLLSNLLADLPPAGREETFDEILARPGIRIERIVSHGQVTPEDAPYDQSWDEWVLLVAGSARLWLEDQGEVALAPGDHLLISAGRRHRVAWTDPARATVWLAVHLGG